jgi:hypothetical protein
MVLYRTDADEAPGVWSLAARPLGYAMPSWMLLCSKCELKFKHSTITLQRMQDYFLPARPQFPVGGAELKCPNCGHVALYLCTDLTYKANS